MKPIRILHIVTTMNRGGAETMIMNYYKSIDRTKIQFDFIVHRESEGVFEKEIVRMGGRIFRLPPLTPFNYFDYFKKANLFFKKHKEYKIIHSQINALSLPILKISKKNKIPIRIAHSHTSIEPILKKILTKNTDLKTIAKDAIQSMARHNIPEYATHFFACGEKAGKWLFGNKNKHRIKIINNAINSKLFIYDKEKAFMVKENYGISQKKVIGHVGNFVEAKNHIFLIDIFYEMQKIDESLVLVLVGNGYLKKKIEEKAKNLLIEGKVFFLGIRDDVNLLMQAFDLIIFPSIYEGLPVTLIEAQASGIRILASDAVTREVQITNLVNFMELEKSSKSWAIKAIELLDYEKTDTSELIKNANYDITKNALELQKFYLDVWN